MYNQQLNIFLCVADCGSFTKASERLYISSTSVMNQINSLENHLDIQLFQRTPRGVVLTEAGKSIYKDAKRMIALSNEAISNARQLSQNKQYTIRVGTSLLNPCRPLMQLWYQANAQYPHFKIQIVPYDDDYSDNGSIIQELGKRFDFMVGPCDSSGWLSQCNFLQLGTYRICCAVPYSHPLSSKKLLEPEDLSGEQLMLVKQGDSKIIDEIRSFLSIQFPDVKLVDTSFYYDMEVFNRCEQEGNLLLTLDGWTGVHPLLATIPVNWNYVMPYGLIYALDPPKSIQQFIDAVQQYI